MHERQTPRRRFATKESGRAHQLLQMAWKTDSCEASWKGYTTGHWPSDEILFFSLSKTYKSYLRVLSLSNLWDMMIKIDFIDTNNRELGRLAGMGTGMI